MDSSSSSTASGSSMASPCASGCGFFGSAANHGLCSKCYTAYLREFETVLPTAVIVRDEKVAAVPSDRPEPEPESIAVVRNKNNRCGSCNKKIGLVGFECKCGASFCGTHRYPEKHACGFDYREAGRVTIREENPVCKADKIEYRI